MHAAALAFLALLAFIAYLFSAPETARTNKEAERFFVVASQGVHLLDALREAPAFHGVYFGGCAHIEKMKNSGNESAFMFVPKVGERVKFKSVKEAMDANTAMLRDYEPCRQTSVVFMDTFPYRGVVIVELDNRGYVKKARTPQFSN